MSVAKREGGRSRYSLFVDQKIHESLKSAYSEFAFFRSRAVRVFWKYIKPYRKKLAGVLVGSLLLSALRAAESVYVIALLKLIVTDQVSETLQTISIGSFSVSVPFIWVSPLVTFFILIVGLLLLNAYLNYRLIKTMSGSQSEIMVNLRSSLVKKTLEKDLAFFSEAKVSEIISLMTMVTSRISTAITTFQNLFLSFLTAAFTLVIMFQLSALFTVSLMAGASVLFLFSKKYRAKLIDFSYKINISQKTAIDDFLNTLTGVRFIKQSGQEELWIGQNKSRVKEWEKDVFRFDLYNKRAVIIAEFVLIAGLLAFFVFMKSAFAGQVSWQPEILLPFAYISYRFVRELKTTVGHRLHLSQIIPQMVIVSEYIDDDTHEEIKGQKSKTAQLEMSQIQHGVAVQNLEFSYENEKKVLQLQNQELLFPKGQVCALVGQSGSGKSTLLDLLARNMKPDAGEIRLDNVSTFDLEDQSFYQHLGYASQDAFLFNGTVRENLLFVSPNATEEKIWEALSQAQAREFVEELPDGLDTEIGEKGARISGGQRQRLSLARVFLKEPSLLFLDESTNALDYKTESEIYAEILRRKADRVTVVAAHRLSSIVPFDQIFVFEQGKLVEQGSHEELMNKKGFYSVLFELQKYQQN